MSEHSLAELLANEHVNRTTAIAVTHSLEHMANYLAENHDLVGQVSQAVLTHLFPHYERNRSRSVAEHPIAAVTDFWTGMYELTSYQPTALEQRMMAVDAESGTVFLHKLETALAAKDKPVIIAHSLYPVREAIRQQKFQYRTLADLK